MTPEQKQLVTISFEKVEPILDKAGVMLYNRIFELDPALRSLFHIGIEEQSHKIMSAVRATVQNLDRIEMLLPTLRVLGKRHAEYGVQDRDYDTGGSALIWVLEQGLGEDFTAETREAWSELYRIIAATMRQGAAEMTLAMSA